MKKIELLAPAGNLEKLKVALAYGADAVYIGGREFSLRARASNFSIIDIKEAIKEANKKNAKIYVTMNIIAHNEDLFDIAKFKKYVKDLEKIGVAGVIIADLGFINIIKELAPKLEIHISTQLSILNSEAVNLLETFKISRVVLAREATMEQIKQIKKRTNLELEVFIHGGMCMAVSGRCVLSNYLADRDANRGGCAQSCRWYYDVYKNDKKKLNNKKFTFSSKDLNAVHYIKSLIDAGVSSLKIEGRMKSEHYLGTIIKGYRKLIDSIYENKEFDYAGFISELSKAENRPTSKGFFLKKAGVEEQIFDKAGEIPTQEFVAKVLGYDSESKMVKIEQRNNFNINQELEVFGPELETTKLEIKQLFDEDNNLVEVAKHAKQVLYFKSDLKLNEYDMIRLSK